MLQGGWIAVFLDEGGRPGKLLGQTAVKQGNTTDVKVQLNETLATNSKVWPRFHIDSGKIGTFEFPGADSPGRDASGSVVARQITITDINAPPTSQSPTTLPDTGGSDLSGGFLVVAGILLMIGALLRRRVSYDK